MAKKAKKAKKAKRGRRARPRPKTGSLRSNMKKMRDDLKEIIRVGKDQQGELSEAQLTKAEKTKEALDDALISVRCIQSQAPY